MANNVNPSLAPEIGPDGLVREAPVIAYTEKVSLSICHTLQKYQLSVSILNNQFLMVGFGVGYRLLSKKSFNLRSKF